MFDRNVCFVVTKIILFNTKNQTEFVHPIHYNIEKNLDKILQNISTSKASELKKRTIKPDAYNFFTTTLLVFSFEQ